MLLFFVVYPYAQIVRVIYTDYNPKVRPFMNAQAPLGRKILRITLACMLVSAFLLFLLGQVFMPNENSSENSTFHVFKANWVQVLPDGTEVSVQIPGSCDVAYGEWGILTTRLPQNQEDTSLCFRSMQQELRIYVGDELRKEYSTLDTQMFGHTSTMTYVFCPLYETDAGKLLRVEFMSESAYSNYISDIYAGNAADIRDHFFDLYGPGLAIAVLLLIISLTVIAGSLMIRIIYKRNVDLLHLGNVFLITSTWLIAESKLRQFIFPSSTVAMWMGFFMIALLPYPFLSYLNSIQKGRYQKAFNCIGICTAVNYVLMLGLQALNIRDFFETMTLSHIIIIALIILMAFSMIRDVVKGYVKEYKEVALGFVIAIIGGICELSLVYIVDTRINGIALCFGMLALLLTATLKTIRDFLAVENERQRAIAASESKAKFLANMSHEIRTPINVVLGMNEMILRENKDATISEYADNIKSAGNLLLSLINDILDFSKLEAGKLQIVENDYSLSSLLKDVMLGADIRAKQKQLELQLDIDQSMPSVLRGDDIRIRQILNNLLSNAIKYTDKGCISFTAKGIRTESGFSLLFSVKDTGIGISKEDMEKLFDSFQRLELSKNRYIQGTGLGLNIAKQLVDSMHGTIEVESEHGRGSCFTIQIPQVIIDDTTIGIPKPASTNSPGSVPQEEESNPSFCAPDTKILAVDDNHMNLLVLKGLLKRSQVQLDTASGGPECLQMTKEKKYDLILMDHMMPDPDGIETLHLLRNADGNPNKNTKVIVLTANAIEGMREQYLAEGFTDYLSKPIEVENLEAVLIRHLTQN